MWVYLHTRSTDDADVLISADILTTINIQLTLLSIHCIPVNLMNTHQYLIADRFDGFYMHRVIIIDMRIYFKKTHQSLTGTRYVSVCVCVC